ncbi:protein SCAR3 isoform X1 [Ziziphus jujuba]|uniref:Protein SCAR n=2 Tax=Ziziphus jujuba TaxID=326968 RepID=A0ABM3IH02_ZIZJJ|nr:protein SCAR3 isoform X1 [Ziziphus jujuba]
MPLVRFQVRNEYGLGQPELYKEANKEDPKAVLDGVAVAGLVGILRQLGDLAEFAAEVFHGLQEQVMTTASRSHKLMVRVQHIEAALPPLEKVVLAQTSHIHFAYTAGSEWHPCIRNERNHFIYNDLPHFIMDSYEECCDPPRLHVLDKFDTGGPGSCLKRYSDPTFFKRASATSDEANAEKIQRDKKARRIKKKRSSKQNGEVSRGASISKVHSCSMQFISPIADGRSSPSQTASTVDMTSKYDLGDHSNSFDSRTESAYIECVFHPSSSKQSDEQESQEIPSSKLVQHNDNLDSVLPNGHMGFVEDNFPHSSLQEQVTSSSSCVTWDEKAEIVEPNGQDSGVYENETPDMLLYDSNIDAQGGVAGNIGLGEQMEVCHDAGEDNILESISSRNQIEEIESETDNYMDALNTIESESENDLDCHTKREVEQFASIVDSEGNHEMHELSMHIKDHKPPTFESQTAPYISSNKEMTSDLLYSVSLESVACEHELSMHYQDHKPPTFESQTASCIFSNKEVTSNQLNSVSSESLACENELSMHYNGHKPPTFESENATYISSEKEMTSEQLNPISSQSVSHENELSMHYNDHKPPTFESQNATYISSEKEMTSEQLNPISSESLAYENELSMHYNGHKSPTFESQNATYISSEKEMTSEQLNPISSQSVSHENELSMHYNGHKPPTFESQNATYISSEKEMTSEQLNPISSQSVACENELSMSYKDHDPPTFESQTTTCISSDKEMTSDLLNSISSQSVVCDEMPVSDMSLNKEIPSDLSNSFSFENQPHELSQKAGGSLNSDCSIGSGRTDDISDGLKLESVTIDSVKLASLIGDQSKLESVIGDPSKLESVIGDPSSSASEATDERDPSGDKTISSSCESQESSADISSNHSVKIWTNGFLLGLEPSKPPDFAMSRAVTEDSLNRSIAEAIDTHMLKGEENKGKINRSTENVVSNEKNASSICSTSCPDDQEEGISIMKTSHVFSPTYVDPDNGDFDEPHMHNGYSHVSDKRVKEPSVLKPVAALRVAHDINSTSTEANKENDETSSLVFGLSRRLLSNGFGRNISHAGGEKSKPANSWTSESEQRSEHHRLPERAFKEQFGFGSALNLLTSSPPLEHMKISFHPIDDFESSKLKLKFSDGSQSHESTRDMFPSFQLIPEPAIPVDDFDSDSDDDTFCRSSPYMSDDCLSHHSDSNSEQWESRETPDRNDEIYDSLCGISSTECISSSMELGGIKQVNSGNGVEASISDPILDLPNFDAVKPALQRETKNDSDSKNHLLLSPGVTPAPPPLPPVQWCVLKPQMDLREGKQDIASDGFDHAFGAKILGPTTFQQPKLAAAKQEQTNEEPFAVKAKLKQLDKQKKEANEALNGKDIDERGDFLQQIRAKSFSLRRTVTEKSTTITPGPAANVKVTAILEKANAIRQAVGSDDGEDDDKWSDT